MGEQRDADELAERLAANPNLDIAMNVANSSVRNLARQLLRRRETIQKLESRLSEMCDGTTELIQANRDAILRIHEEGLAKIKKQCEYVAGSLAQSETPPPIVVKDLQEHANLTLAVIEAINTFHPMHGESWKGWPEGS